MFKGCLMKIFFSFFTAISLLFFMKPSESRVPLKDDWTQTFYTDDSSLYLKLYPDGFKQLVRVSADSCDQITQISVVLKDSTQRKMKSFKASKFLSVTPKDATEYYGLNLSDYCWYEVEQKGLTSIDGIQYVLKIEDNASRVVFFKGITNSLVPHHRLAQVNRQGEIKIDSWIELGNFGATPVIGGGVFYKIWEPLSDEVHLFINENKPIKLNSYFNLKDERRFHSAYLKDSKVRDLYHFQFVKNGIYENLEVANFNTFSPIKIDPMAREIVYEAKGGRFNGYINPRAVVVGPNSHKWRHDQKILSMSDEEYNNWIIYQLWPLTFNPKLVDGAYTQGKFLDIIPKIPYVSQLGVTSVELLPIHESRFNASWGYALDSLLAIESTLGTSTEVKKLVDELHANKLKVIFDVVLNHVNNNLLREPINESNNSSKFYSGDTPWGPKPRFESVWVRKWITDSLIQLMNDYHVDGFRFDMTDSIFNGTPGGYSFLQELMYLSKVNNPRFYNSAEQLPDNVWVTFPIEENGIGFDSQWNDRFKNFFELEFDDYSQNRRNVDLTHLANSMLGLSDHQMSPGAWYSFGDPNRTVNYLGSHDFVGNKDPLIRIVSKYRSSEKVDDNIFSRVNPLEEESDLVVPFRTIHNTFTHALVRLAYGILFTKPGAVLFYQGEELAQDLNIQNEWDYVKALKGNRFPSKNVNIDKYVRSHRMTWHYYDLALGKSDPLLNFVTDEEANLFKGHLNFFKTMIKFRKDYPSLSQQEAQNVRINQQNKTFTYELHTEDDVFFVVGNFNFDNGGAWIEFPYNEKGWWEEMINSSTVEFGGNDETYQNIVTKLSGRNNLIRLKGPGLYIFKTTSIPKISKRVYFRSNAFNWDANPLTELKQNAQNPEEYSVKLNVPAMSSLEFKVATKGWEIEMGKSSGQTLNYIPNSPNVKASVTAGQYLFKFNIKTFSYSFTKL